MSEEQKVASIEPTGLNVIVRELNDSEETTSGGLIIPSTVARGNLKSGRVVAAGKGAWQFGNFIENPIKTGDVIIFDHRGVSELQHNREKLLVVENQLIKGKFTDTE